MATRSLKVPLVKLSAFFDPDSLGFETTDEIEPLGRTVGQDRAVGALEFGLNIDAPGYNIYVVGFPGTGRTTTLDNHLRRAAASRPVPDDWCYVHNFHDPLQPVAVRLPAGEGRQLVQDIDDLVRDCARDIPRAFESDEYRVRVEEAMREVQHQRDAITQGIEAGAREQGFVVQQSPVGLLTAPVKDGQPISREQYSQLPEAERNALREKSERLQEFINRQLTELRRVEREASQRRTQVDRDVLIAVIGPSFRELKEKHRRSPVVTHYLEDMQEDIAAHLDDFRAQPEPAPHPQGEPDSSSEASPEKMPSYPERFIRYKVNVLVDNSRTQGAPVIFEYSPTYYNLFGRVEYSYRPGGAATDLTMIRPGAVHLASGGYLAVQAKDLLAAPGAWDALKRVLRSGESRIENLAEQYTPIPTSTLRPQPIPIQAKIILIGTPYLIGLLQRVDEDFRKLFKVKADFDISMERTPENVRFFASFVRNRSMDSGVRPFHKSAVAKLVEHASRLVEHQGRLTTRFIDISDLITEADYWAKHDDHSPTVMAQHVSKAIQERAYRTNLVEERIQQYINDGTIIIDTDGSVVGQVNGMSVLDLGDYIFGRPVRITARTSLGRGQFAHIDRDAQMTGRTHNKGFLILTGYLMGKYGHERPLPVRSTIGFEQTYDETEGDSASSAELYALLSSLSGIPIQQGIAVTGSVNQQGEVQAVGGVTHKIEGFYAVCKAKGLDGRQGVIIPRDNVKNLVLRDEVVQAVRRRKFAIYAVDSVEQGLEVLMGVPAGTPDDNGAYPEGTLNHAIVKNLERLAAKVKEMEAHGEPSQGLDSPRDGANHGSPWSD